MPTSTGAAAARSGSVALGVALLVEAAVVAVLAVVLSRTSAHPVVASFVGDRGRIGPVTLARVDALWAAVVLLAWVGVTRSVGRVARRPLRLIEHGITAPVLVFLVAQLNGITDLGALVPLYALATVPALCFLLQERVRVQRGHPQQPAVVAAAVGIVPWGVIAFFQIGAGISGASPSGAVRIVTLVVLAFAAVLYEVHRRGVRGHDLVTALQVSAFAWIVFAALT